MTIAIIGFGRFGKTITKFIHKHFPQWNVLISSRKKRLSLSPNSKKSSFETAAASDIVIPCVPISEFENVIIALKPHLKPTTIVIDVCSVKAHPVNIMKKHLPKSVSILATHPMWGPDSAKNSLANLTTVISPIRINPQIIDKIKTFSRQINHRILIMSPEKHDQLLARSQALTHLIGRLNQSMNITSTSFDTQGFKQLLKIQSFVTNDSWQLFQDMFHFNPHAQKMLKLFSQNLTKLTKQIENKRG